MQTVCGIRSSWATDIHWTCRWTQSRPEQLKTYPFLWRQRCNCGFRSAGTHTTQNKIPASPITRVVKRLSQYTIPASLPDIHQGLREGVGQSVSRHAHTTNKQPRSSSGMATRARPRQAPRHLNKFGSSCARAACASFVWLGKSATVRRGSRNGGRC